MSASRTTVIKYLLVGIACVIGGIVLLNLVSITRGLAPGLILGAIIALIGFIILSSKKDSLIGLIIVAAGVLILVSKIPYLGGIAYLLIVISGWVLIVVGIISFVKFILSVIKNM